MRRFLVVAAIVAAGLLVPAAPSFAGTWCGSGVSATDRVPDAPAGLDVHVMYVTASDTPDHFTDHVDQIVSDVQAISAWWPTQDFTRAPRFDLYAFPGCPAPGGLDVSDVHLAQTASSFLSITNRYSGIAHALFDSGFASKYKKYLVFYDGPLDDGYLCGQGSLGPSTSGPSYAIVYMQACTQGSDQAAVAPHELVHTLLGPLPASAPHACPGDNGHPCDSDLDLLYPYNTNYRPLSQYSLDYNHDDYYSAIEASPWLQVLNQPAVPLAITFGGGAGTVATDLPGQSCTASCTVGWQQGTTVTLTATPASGQRFVGWRGGSCSANPCTVKLDAATPLTALFGPMSVLVKVTIAGRGSIFGSFACTRSCSQAVVPGDDVVLRPQTRPGWTFAGWSGACRGKLYCERVANADTSITATFARLPKAIPKKKGHS